MKKLSRKFLSQRAFTLLELVFVIVVIGIISATVIPRTNSNNLQEAATQMISHIRYTQHLAMMDDHFDAGDSNWYKNKWQFIYGKSNSSSRDTGGYYAYSIFSDWAKNSQGKPDLREMAINPANKSKYLSGGYSGTLDWKDDKASKKLNIGYSYSIDNITKSGCEAQRISFDYLGRPFKKNDKIWDSSVKNLLTKKCTFTLHSDGKKIDIIIEPETGYTHL